MTHSVTRLSDQLQPDQNDARRLDFIALDQKDRD